jgi:hypothetical protein
MTFVGSFQAGGGRARVVTRGIFALKKKNFGAPPPG